MVSITQPRNHTTNEILIRRVLPKDLEDCFLVETSGFPPEEAATKETMKLRLETFPQGLFVAETAGRVVGILNSGATDKEDISDEELKQLIGHEPDGKNMIVFALAVLPEFQKRGIARQLMARFVEEARARKKENVSLLCKQQLIAYYERMGFVHVGLSKSTHGGAEWHEMRLELGNLHEYP
jgi:ribosomal protein S18 acetylase RimI-like enzyme